MSQGRVRRGGHQDRGHPRRQRDARDRMTSDELDQLVQGVGVRLQRELAALSQALNTRFDRLEGRLAAAEERLVGVERGVAAIGRAVGADAGTGDPADRSRAARGGNR